MISIIFWSVVSSLLAGGFLTTAYYLYFFLMNYIETHFVSSITLESQDNMFQWTLDYLFFKGYISKGISNFTCKLQRTQKSSPFWSSSKEIDQDLQKPSISYTPGIGFHSFVYKGLKINFSHKLLDKMRVGYEKKPVSYESITLFAYGLGHVHILKDLCNEALNHALEHEQDTTNIYALARYFNFWVKVQSKKHRPLDTVILDSNISEEIINDVKNFKQSREWYVARGVPYRRGYLLYGPPGTGKTSFLLAIAGVLKLSICTLNLSGNELDDENLNKVLESAPLNSIILLEDVDAIFIERTSVGQKREGRKVSFSGLLNALDGVRSQEGRILFMTTNHIEKLDPALLRPGRADVHVKLDYATSKQIKQMFLRFFPEEDKSLAEEFAKKVPENKLSMAKIQGHLLRNKDCAKKAVDSVNDLIEIEEYTNEMSLKEWLFRVGLEEFAGEFFKENVWRVRDLKGFSEGDLEKYGIKSLGHQKRFINLLQGDDKAKKAFVLLSKAGIRSLIRLYEKNNQKVEEYVQIIPEFLVSEYNLRDVLDEESRESVENRLVKLVEKAKKFRKTGIIEKKKEVPAVKYPEETPEDILIRLGMQKFIEDFKNNNALSPDIFYSLSNDDVQRTMNVGLVGKRMKLMKIIKDFQEKKDKEEEDFPLQSSMNVIGLKKQTSINY